VKVEARLYNPLLVTDLAKVLPGHDWTTYLNPNSLERITSCLVEPSLQQTVPGERYQFERLGYFCTDQDSAPGTLIFNRTVSLKDAWAKIEKTQQAR
jgi:glutaminyl-tRNA synthetase